MTVEYTVGALTKALEKDNKQSGKKKMVKKSIEKPLKSLFSSPTKSVLAEGQTPFKVLDKRATPKGKMGRKKEEDDNGSEPEIILKEKRTNELGNGSSKKKKKQQCKQVIKKDSDTDIEILQSPKKAAMQKQLVLEDEIESEGVKSESDDDNILSSPKLNKSGRGQKRKFEEEDRRTIFVGNLPTTITPKDINELVQPYGIVESVRLRSVTYANPTMPRKLSAIRRDFHPDRHNMNAYCRFKLEDEAKAALALNGHKIEGHTLRVDMSQGEADKKKNIFLGNLPFRVDEDTIRSHFEDCGAIDNVRVVRDVETGFGKGFGFVSFKSEDSVYLALKLNQSILNGRPIRVKECSHFPHLGEGSGGNCKRFNQGPSGTQQGTSSANSGSRKAKRSRRKRAQKLKLKQIKTEQKVIKVEGSKRNKSEAVGTAEKKTTKRFKKMKPFKATKTVKREPGLPDKIKLEPGVPIKKIKKEPMN